MDEPPRLHPQLGRPLTAAEERRQQEQRLDRLEGLFESAVEAMQSRARTDDDSTGIHRIVERAVAAVEERRSTLPPEPNPRDVRRIKRTPGKLFMTGLALVAALGSAGGAIYGGCMGGGVLVENQVKAVLVRSSLICPPLDPDAEPVEERFRCKTLAEKVAEVREAQDAQSEAQRATNAKLDAVLRRLPQEPSP